MTKKRARQERAARRLIAALDDKKREHVPKNAGSGKPWHARTYDGRVWKSEDGPVKAQICLSQLQSKGIKVD
jgi:hypothetical protein